MARIAVKRASSRDTPTTLYARRVIDSYLPLDPGEAADLERVRDLLKTVEDPWARENPLHLTASALIVHPPTGRVLLRWHHRLKMWLQVGGHGDPGEHDPVEIVLREAREETGLMDLRLLSGLMHVVIVSVPAAGGEPAHMHADLRYLLATDEPETARPENSSSPLRWLSFDQAKELMGQDILGETLARAQTLML
jgi:8-oxo-dGTP pyrophosphatase MutT (NUDIX family)